jgi:hypothetical protein
MKTKLLTKISELDQEDKNRLYKLIKGFVFENEIDIRSEKAEAYQSRSISGGKLRRAGFRFEKVIKPFLMLCICRSNS